MATIVAGAIGLISAGASLVAGGAITGFAFAGGASAFQEVKTEIKKATKKHPDATHANKGRIDGNNPFNDTRFLNNIEKRELSDLIKG